jgi:hypothetical protein
MKPFLLSLFACFFLGNVYSQGTKIRFQYDDAGNQTIRTLCINCEYNKTADNASMEKQSFEKDEIDDGFKEDIISFYPNPVQEELILKWELIDEKKVSKIDITNLNGQNLKTLKDLARINTTIISFQEFPTGVYFVMITYTNGEYKSIKIVKK